MTFYEAQAVATVREYGVNHMVIRPVAFEGWKIFHQTDACHAETVFAASTREECEDIIRKAQEV